MARQDRASLFSSIIAALENATDEKLLKRAKDALESARRETTFDERAQAKLEPLRAEIEFHLKMRQAAHVQEQAQYSQAAELYRDARQRWHQISYRDLLRFQVENPYELAKQCQELAYRVETPRQLAAQADARLKIAVEPEEEEFVRLGLRAGLLASPGDAPLLEKLKQLSLRRNLRAVRVPLGLLERDLLDDLIPTKSERAANMLERERAWLDSALKYVKPFVNNEALRGQEFDAFYFGCLSLTFLLGVQLQVAERQTNKRQNIQYVITHLSGQAKTDWDALSENARYVLSRLIHPNPRVRYATASQVLKTLDDLTKRWEKTPTALAQTRRKADMNALFDLDFARRRALADGIIIEGLEERYGELYAQFKGRWEKLAQDARLAIETGRYQEAIEMLGASPANDQEAADADMTIALQLKRYRLMAKACLNALTEYPHKQLWQRVVNEMQGDPRPFPKSEEERRRGTIMVTRALADMDDEAKIENVREILDAATKPGEGMVLASAMRLLYAEADLYFNLRQGRLALARGQFQEARGYYADTKKNWQDIPYQDSLEFMVENLDSATEQVESMSKQFPLNGTGEISETERDLQDAQKCAEIRRSFLLGADNGSANQLVNKARQLQARQMLATVRSTEMQENAMDKATAILELTRLAELLTAFPDDAFGKRVRSDWENRLIEARAEFKRANNLTVGVKPPKDLEQAKRILEQLHPYAFDASEIELVKESKLNYPEGLSEINGRIKALDERILAQRGLAAKFVVASQDNFSEAEKLLEQAKKQEVMLDDTPLEAWAEKLNRWIDLEKKVNQLKGKMQSANGTDALFSIQTELDGLSQTARQDIPLSLSKQIETLQKRVKSKWDAEFKQVEAKIKHELNQGKPDQAQKLLSDALDIANKSNSSEFVNQANALQIAITDAYKKQVATAKFWLGEATEILDPKPSPSAAKPDYELAAKYLLLAEERLVEASNRGDASVQPDLNRLVELRAKLPAAWQPKNFEELLQRAAEEHVQTAQTKWQNQEKNAANKDAAFQELEQATLLWPTVEIKDDALKTAWEELRRDRIASLEQFTLATQLYEKEELEQAVRAIDRAIELREKARPDEMLEKWRQMRRTWFGESQFRKASAASALAQQHYEAGNLDQAIVEISNAIQARLEGLTEQEIGDVERQQDAEVVSWNKQKDAWSQEQGKKKGQWQVDEKEWQGLVAVPTNRERANEKLAAMEQNAKEQKYLSADQAKLTTMRQTQNACAKLAQCAVEWKNIKRDKKNQGPLNVCIGNTQQLLENIPDYVSAKYWEEIAKNVRGVQDSFFQQPLWNNSDGTKIFISLEVLIRKLNKRATLSQQA